MPTLTPAHHLERLKLLANARADFDLVTEGAADAIARAFHDAKLRKRSGDGRTLQAITQECMRRMAGGETLEVVDVGLAGGAKVSDSRTGAFFKIAEDMGGIYEGSSVMADKAAKHELAMLTHLHDTDAARLLTVPLASCADVTVRDEAGRPERVYRVQGFSRHAVGKDTLRVGSCDGGISHHMCDVLDGVAEKLAASLHLGPSCQRPSKLVRHEYRIVRDKRDPQRFPRLGAAVAALLESVGAGRDAAESSGVCSQLERDHGVMLDPLRSAHAEHSAGESSDRDVVSSRLPFDVELHALPCGDVVLLDTHRLCIPEVDGEVSHRDSCGQVAIVWAFASMDGMSQPVLRVVGLPEGGMDDEAMSSLAARRAGLLATTSAPQWKRSDLDALASSCGVSVLHASDGRIRVLLPRFERYWRAPQLTALFRPEAAAVLRAAGAEPVSPDAVMAGGADADGSGMARLMAARDVLLGKDNVDRAADAVLAQLAKCLQSGHGDCIASVRTAVKVGMHTRGLGLRHAWEAMRQLLDCSAEGDCAGLPKATLDAAVGCASLPSPGSSGAAALECLVASGPVSDEAWLLACCVARGVAARGKGVRNDHLVRLATVYAGKGWGVARAWAGLQAKCIRRVKVSGAGLQHEREGAALTFGDASAEQAEQAIASQLEGLKLGQRLCCSGSDDLHLLKVMWLAQTCGRASKDGELELLCLLVAAAMCGNVAGKTLGVGILQECTDRLLDRSELSAALELLERFADVQARTLGEGHPDFANTLSTMAQCLHAMGEYEKALVLLAQCARIEISSLGEAHPDYGRTLYTMAQCRRKLGEADAALELLRKCVGVFESSLDEDHPDYCRPLYLIAQCKRDKGEYDEALELLGRCAATYASTLGDDHPTFARTLHAMAQCQRSKANNAEALALLERCVQSYSSSLGRDHPDFAGALYLMGQCRLETGDVDEALELLKRSDQVYSSTLGDDHPRVAGTLLTMAQCHRSKGDFGEALALLDRAADIFSSTLGEDHPHFAASLFTMAQCQLHLANYDAALELLGRCKDIQARSFGADHPHFAGTLFTMAQCYRNKGDFAMALELLQQCEDIFSRTIGEDHPNYKACARLMQTCLQLLSA